MVEHLFGRSRAEPHTLFQQQLGCGTPHPLIRHTPGIILVKRLRQSIFTFCLYFKERICRVERNCSGCGAAAPPVIKNEDFHCSYSCRVVRETFIYVPISLLLFTQASFYELQKINRKLYAFSRIRPFLNRVKLKNIPDIYCHGKFFMLSSGLDVL